MSWWHSEDRLWVLRKSRMLVSFSDFPSFCVLGKIYAFYTYSWLDDLELLSKKIIADNMRRIDGHWVACGSVGCLILFLFSPTWQRCSTDDAMSIRLLEGGNRPCYRALWSWVALMLSAWTIAVRLKSSMLPNIVKSRASTGISSIELIEGSQHFRIGIYHAARPCSSAPSSSTLGLVAKDVEQQCLVGVCRPCVWL